MKSLQHQHDSNMSERERERERERGLRKMLEIVIGYVQKK